jgi:hypothetical protein
MAISHLQMIEYFRMNIEDLWYRFALSFIQSGYGINHVQTRSNANCLEF